MSGKDEHARASGSWGRAHLAICLNKEAVEGEPSGQDLGRYVGGVAIPTKKTYLERERGGEGRKSEEDGGEAGVGHGGGEERREEGG